MLVGWSAGVLVHHGDPAKHPDPCGQVKRLQNIAYQLGQEETKEMTRGKYLNILRCHGWTWRWWSGFQKIFVGR